MITILVTGCAGFIGSHACEKLLENNENKVIGIDNINDYYDVEIKKNNIEILNKYSNFLFIKSDIRDTNVISHYKPDKIIHLASMAGVRYSINNPQLYFDVNVNGFIHLLEESVKNNVKHVVFASSSSVYGLNKKIPFSEHDKIETCNSPYACSKMAMELIAKTYHQLYDMSLIGLRFFTVYGPRGRPDMAPYKFLNSIFHDKELIKYGDGTSSRDYTYISDIVDGILGAHNNNKNINFGIYNLGNNNPCTLNEFINNCEKAVGKKAKIKQIKNQLGDVPHTCADITNAIKDLNYSPKVSLVEGLKNIVRSYN